MTMKMWHFRYFLENIDKVHWIFPHGLNCLKIMYVHILYLFLLYAFSAFETLHTFDIYIYI